MSFRANYSTTNSNYHANMRVLSERQAAGSRQQAGGARASCRRREREREREREKRVKSKTDGEAFKAEARVMRVDLGLRVEIEIYAAI